jgi:hypothetical protein
MIKVKAETIETFIELQNRNEKDYYRTIVDEMLKENKSLITAIQFNAEKVVESMDRYEGDDLKCHIRTNLISACMAVYQTIKAQLEAEELEKLYGET